MGGGPIKRRNRVKVYVAYDPDENEYHVHDDPGCITMIGDGDGGGQMESDVKFCASNGLAALLQPIVAKGWTLYAFNLDVSLSQDEEDKPRKVSHALDCGCGHCECAAENCCHDNASTL